MERTKRNDAILIAAVLIIAVGAYAGARYYQGQNTKDAVAVVKVGETEYGRFPLNEDVTEKIELSDGSYNILKIHEGKADITEASCPDGICVKHRAISRQRETIVCLPNEVVVEIENGEESDVDSMTN